MSKLNEPIAHTCYDINKYIKKWSLEPFSIQYYKPTTKKFHRYFVDLYIEFENNQKFIQPERFAPDDAR